ncbi:MAG: tetratricopeptide repeat protein [Bdellovibrionales bacterium]
MRTILLTSSILFIVLSCSSLSEKQNLPPENLMPVYKSGMAAPQAQKANALIEQYMEENKEKAAHWWGKYNRAMILTEQKPTEACVLFTELSQEKDFPLQAIANLRSYQTCPVTRESAQRLWQTSRTFPVWTKSLAVDISLTSAASLSAKKEQIQFLEEKAKFTSITEERIELFQAALLIARELRDKESIKRVEKKLHTAAPRFQIRPPKENYLKVAHDFRKARDFENARKYYRLVFEDRKRKTEDRLAALKGIRFVFKTENKKEDYLEATRKIAKFTGALLKFNKRVRDQAKLTNLHIDAQLLLTRTLWTAGDVQGSLLVLKQLAQKYKKHPQASEVHWLIARISEEAGNYEEALKGNKIALQLEKEGTALWEKLVWQKAWNQRKLKDFAAAAHTFLTLIDKTKKSDYNIKYRFWYGRVLKEHQQKEEAEKTFQALISDDPMGYYGLLAYREIGLQYPPLTAKSSKTFEKPSFVSEEDYKVVKWLASVGETTLLRSFIKRVTAKTSFFKMNTEDQSRILNWYAAVDDYLGLFQQYGWILATHKELLTRHADLIFPRPHEAVVRTVASDTGVKPELIYSIMRQESGFNPRARSPMDAFGLMQLIPNTAEIVAKERSYDYKQTDDLYKPVVNITIGSALLKKLMSQFDKQFIITVASYNASEDAVLTWLKTRYRDDPLEFIEDIPYSETMTYIKLVLRNFIYYSRLADQDDSMDFPEWCLEGLQSLKTSSLRSPVSVQ